MDSLIVQSNTHDFIPQTDPAGSMPRIDPAAFANAVKDHWVAYQNTPSDKLMKLWRTMADTYNAAVASTYAADPSKEKVRVLQPPTGSAKSLGAQVYAAMSAKANFERREGDRLGILILVREIDDAREMVKGINASFQKLGGVGQPAVTRHSENSVSLEELGRFDVVVITHAAWLRAVDQRRQTEWMNSLDYMMEFTGNGEFGQRRLVVCDESLSSAVEAFRVNIGNINEAVFAIPASIQRDYPREMACLDHCRDALKAIQSRRSESVDEATGKSLPLPSRVVWSADPRLPVTFENADGSMVSMRYQMSGLLAAIKGKIRSQLVTDEDEEGNFKRINLEERVAKTLRSVEALYARWAWFEVVAGKDETLNSSRVLLPIDLSGVVILDATGRRDTLWQLMGPDRVEFAEVDPSVRNYRNAKVHIKWIDGGSLGKQKMIEHAKHRMLNLVDDLGERWAGQPPKKLLQIVHKKVVEHLDCLDQSAYCAPRAITKRDSQGNPVEKIVCEPHIAHWGSIDGKNKWSDCDTVVLVGLPYRGSTWAINVFMAVKGPQPEEWFKTAKQVRDEMEVEQMSGSVIQAVNRGRCRKVINAEGDCLPTEIFICLPANKVGRKIEEILLEAMPGAERLSWGIVLDRPDETPTAANADKSTDTRLLAMLRAAEPGQQLTIPFLKEKLGLGRNTMKDLIKRAANTEHRTGQELVEMAVRYVSKMGRGAEPYFTKD
jgi:hypothetical protein